MKKFFATAVSAILLAAPTFALAATVDDLNAQIAHLLAQITALRADESVTCTILTSRTTVHPGEHFTFMWYSTGMHAQTTHDGRAWDPFGVITMALSKPGTWTYTLKFYDLSGTEIPCTTRITVSS